MGLEQDVQLLSVLVEPQRRRVYDELQAAEQPMTLTELGDALQLSRTLLAFHVGKLVDAGFVDVLPASPGESRRGRPSQRYRASRREVSASVPVRHYDVVAQVLLAAAADAGPDEPLEEAAGRAGRRRGAELAAQTPSPRRGGPLLRAERLLAVLGYAPARYGDEVLLRNCPFDRLRDTNCALVCGINVALAEGYLEALGVDDELTARLRPAPDLCCVVVGPA